MWVIRVINHLDDRSLAWPGPRPPGPDRGSLSLGLRADWRSESEAAALCRGRGLLPARARSRQTSAVEVTAAAGGNQPRQADGRRSRSRAAGGGLRLLHRRPRHPRPAGSPGGARRSARHPIALIGRARLSPFPARPAKTAPSHRDRPSAGDTYG